MRPFSVIIPIYNEAEVIEKIIKELQLKLKENFSGQYEIIAVNDGSTDRSKEILEAIPGIKIISHPYNKGYGASLKTGAKNAKFDWLLFFDADGQHKPEYIKEFIQYGDQYDMIIGARQGYKGPFWRQPGKKIIHLIANYLAGTKIPDLNCGFRLLRKDLFLKYEHIFPSGFSLSTTSTLAFLREGLNIKYIPIAINKRVGKSTVKISDGLRAIMLVVRLIMLFSPLKIFVPLAFIGFFISFTWMIHDFIVYNFSLISKSAGFIFVASLLIFLFGLLADQIAAIRREIKRN